MANMAHKLPWLSRAKMANMGHKCATSLLDLQHFQKDESTNNHRLASIGRRTFPLQKCPAACGEKGDAIVVESLVPAVSREITVRSAAVFLV